jgi:hypothetical protein
LCLENDWHAGKNDIFSHSFAHVKGSGGAPNELRLGRRAGTASRAAGFAKPLNTPGI